MTRKYPCKNTSTVSMGELQNILKLSKITGDHNDQMEQHEKAQQNHLHNLSKERASNGVIH